MEGGTSKRLLTAGKYCDRDIVVTAQGGGGGGGDSNGGEKEIAALLMNTLETLDNNVATSLRSRACQDRQCYPRSRD